MPESNRRRWWYSLGALVGLLVVILITSVAVAALGLSIWVAIGVVAVSYIMASFAAWQLYSASVYRSAWDVIYEAREVYEKFEPEDYAVYFSRAQNALVSHGMGHFVFDLPLPSVHETRNNRELLRRLKGPVDGPL